MKLCKDAGVIGKSLLHESDIDAFRRRFDNLVDLYLASDELGPAAELCRKVLARGRELGLDAQDHVSYQTRLIGCLLKAGSVRDATELTEDLVSKLDGPGVLPKTAARAFALASIVAGRLGDLERAQEHLGRGVELIADVADLDVAAHLKFAEGHLCLERRELDAALEAYYTASGNWSLLGKHDEVTKARCSIALVEFAARRFRSAARAYAKCVDALRDGGSRRLLATRLMNLGVCHVLLGEWGQAEQALHESLRIATQMGFTLTKYHCMMTLGALRCRLRDLAAARALLDDALRLAEESGPIRDQAVCLEFLGIVEYEVGNYDQALRFYARALTKARQLSERSDCVSEVLRHQAEALNGLGRYSEALAKANECLQISTDNGDRTERAAAHRAIAVAQSALEETSEAEDHFRTALEEFRQLEEPFELAKVLFQFGCHLLRAGTNSIELGRAAEYLREARTRYSGLELSYWIDEVDQRLEAIVSEELGLRDEVRRVDSVEGIGWRSPCGGSWAGGSAAHRPGRDSSPKPIAPSIITRSSALRTVLERITCVAPSDLPILILGERGTGKELIAGAVHAASGRPLDKLVTVNCAAIPRELQDSELFGHRKGSFTGATADKVGLFEQADGGTIFLDEIADLAMEAQAKLLRVLESGELRKVGEHRCRRVDARVVAATNHNLLKSVSNGGFRADLYDRLDGFQVEVPPLRTRREDVGLLTDHFLDLFCSQYSKQVEMPDQLREVYRTYNWPGNVRELRQEVHRLVLLTPSGEMMATADSQVAAQAHVDQVAESARSGLASGLSQTIDETERRLITDALNKARGNKAQAARLLNMSRTTLLGKIKRLQID